MLFPKAKEKEGWEEQESTRHQKWWLAKQVSMGFFLAITAFQTDSPNLVIDACVDNLKTYGVGAKGVRSQKFMSFRNIGAHPKTRMPIAEEFRALILDGEIMTVVNYWDEVEYPGVLPDLKTLLPAVAEIPSCFFTLDFASLPNGNWMIVESGDGQVSGLQNNADLKQFYDALVKGIKI